MMFPGTRGAALGVLLALPGKKGDSGEFLDYDRNLNEREGPPEGGPR